MALSGSFNTNSSTTYSGGYKPYLHFSWSASQNTSANTSTVYWKIEVQNSGWSGYKNSDVYLDIWRNGGDWERAWTSSSRFEMRKDWSTSGSFTVYHNSSSGVATFGARVYGAIEWYAYNWSGSGSWTLNTIPRGSTINSVPAFNLEDAISCSVTKNNTSFVDTLTMKYGSTTIKTISNYTSNSTFTLTNAELLNAYKAMGTAKSGAFTFTVTTYSGSTQVGTASSKDGTGTCAGTVKGNVNGTWYRFLPWVNVNGTWYKALGFINPDDTNWYRGL